MIDQSFRFKNSNNQLYTKRLFYETSAALNDKSDVVYTLKDSDLVKDKTYISLYRRYLDMSDLTEFEFANTYFDSYEHFRMLCETPWFKPFITRWRNELAQKVKLQVFNRLKVISENPLDKNFFEANKMILNELKGPKTSKRGRPSDEEVKKYTKQVAAEDESLKADFDRIINGE